MWSEIHDRDLHSISVYINFYHLNFYNLTNLSFIVSLHAGACYNIYNKFYIQHSLVDRYLHPPNTAKINRKINETNNSNT